MMAARLPRFGAPLCLLALLVGALQLAIWHSGVNARGGLDLYVSRWTDFSPTLTGALIIRDGEGGRLYDLEAQRAAQARIAPSADGSYREFVLIYVHPPAEALLIAPLLALPYGFIFIIWTLASLVAFGLAFWLLTAILRPGWDLGLVLVVAACAYQPAHHVLWLGQNTAFVLLGLCCFYWAWRRERPIWLGSALVLVGLKPQIVPLFVLLLIMRQQWRALLTSATIVGVLTVAIMPISGWRWPLHYLDFVFTVSRGQAVGEHPHVMHSWRGLLLNLLGEQMSFAVAPLLVLLSCATIGVALWAGCRGDRGNKNSPRHVGRMDLSFAFICIAALLISPHLHRYDLALLLVPAFIVARYITYREASIALVRGGGLLLVCGWLLPTVALFIELRESLFVVLSVTFIATAGLLIFWQIAPWQQSRPRETSPSQTTQHHENYASSPHR